MQAAGGAGRERVSAGIRFGGRGRARNRQNGRFQGFWRLSGSFSGLSLEEIVLSDGEIVPSDGGKEPKDGAQESKAGEQVSEGGELGSWVAPPSSTAVARDRQNLRFIARRRIAHEIVICGYIATTGLEKPGSWLGRWLPHRRRSACCSLSSP